MTISLNDWVSPLNPLFVALLRTPGLHWLLSPSLVLVSWTGRKSGRSFTIPVGYQRQGDSLVVMVSKARQKTWWRNFREPWPLRLQLRGRRVEGRGQLLAPGTPEFRDACSESLRRMPWLGGQFGIRYDRRVGLTAAQLESLGREIAALRIHPEPAGSGAS